MLNKNNRLWFFVFLIFIVHFLVTSCRFFHQKQEKNRTLFFFLRIFTVGDYWARIYEFDPQIIFNPKNISYLQEATPENVDPQKPKLILVPGWDFRDRSSVKLPSIDELKQRVLTRNWEHLVSENEFIWLLQNYEVFTFDYLTSDPIDVNGKRLRDLLDRLFLNFQNQVIIYAHSMGGLISRFALYEGEKPNYIKAIITNGTPFHGSPWASPEFQKDKTLLGYIASFLTDTDGGRDLAWDNFDGSIPNAYNWKLFFINQRTDRDDLIFTLYGEIPNGTNFESDSKKTFQTICPLLNDFGPHDCIVPTKSALLNPFTTKGFRHLGNYDHLDINWHTPQIRRKLIDIIQEFQ
ncbi:MAG: hypothetical protein NZ853_01055 [Leptospiraceae bacterium]|nr:hypothetical protein [Leptospiraceae bacterium]MDW7976183.1 hypothetical protein [Leptospiraceae bacterium]